MAAKCMKEILGEMKDIEIVEPVVTVKTSMKEENKEQMNILAKAILN